MKIDSNEVIQRKSGQENQKKSEQRVLYFYYIKYVHGAYGGLIYEREEKQTEER